MVFEQFPGGGPWHHSSGKHAPAAQAAAPSFQEGEVHLSVSPAWQTADQRDSSCKEQIIRLMQAGNPGEQGGVIDSNEEHNGVP
eukprot:441022-Pelagomonas_calceolata.AAC.4